MTTNNYDVIVVGCGPAGLSAAIYALRAEKTVLILEKETIGGQITSSPMVENYPGYSHISGSELMEKMYDQALELGAQIELEEVLSIKDGETKEVTTDMNTYTCKALIIASGAKNRRLGLEKEEELFGDGISTCVTCDGAFYKDKNVGVIGGGNSAMSATIGLLELCKEITLINAGDKLMAEKVTVDRIERKRNVKIINGAKVVELLGEKGKFEGVVIEHKDGKKETLNFDGIFVEIGQVPQSEIVKGLLEIDSNGYIVSNETLTNKEGIFVAGDVRVKSVRQLTTACADGSIAAINAIRYLDK